MRRMRYLAVALAVALLIASCGKKPTFVDAPEGTDPDEFPRTYPSS